MKYLVLIGDGMSDRPLRQLGGKTPLEAARTPNMDHLARNGVCGWVNNVPKGMPPASDVANLSIFGYDPRKYYTGRGPLEAASLGVKLGGNEIAFRCNLVTVKGGRMRDFTAGHISTAQGKKVIRALDNKIGSRQVRFHAGLSYRHLLVISASAAGKALKCTPPHDITGKKIGKYLPKGKGADLLLKLMNESEVLLHGMGTEATMIWPWSPGKTPRMPSFRKRFGKNGAIITAVHLLKGIGRVLRMQVIDVPGATGYLDTNYQGKASYALRALKRNDVIFVHVEAPDEAGHEGDVRKKIKAIEDFDKYVVGTVLNEVRSSKLEASIMVLPDHPTPIKVMTHTAEPVPFAAYSPKSENPCSGIAGYNEKEIKKSRTRVRQGSRLIKLWFGGKLSGV